MLDDWACTVKKYKRNRNARCVLLNDDDTVGGVVTLKWVVKV